MLKAYAKCSDCSSGNIKDKEWSGPIPYGLGIGGGDCGQLQGQWPLPLSELERSEHE
jgi:hypothetical protein